MFVPFSLRLQSPTADAKYAFLDSFISSRDTAPPIIRRTVEDAVLMCKKAGEAHFEMVNDFSNFRADTSRQNMLNSPRLTKAGHFLLLVAAMFAGAAVRIYEAWTASVIAKDGVQFVRMAQAMESDWRASISHIVQFGYPLLIKWAHALIGEQLPGDELMQWQYTAQLVAIVCGTLCIPAVYLLGRRLLSRRVGLLAAWAWALLPEAVRYSSDALADLPCLMFMLWGLVALMTGWKFRSVSAFLWAGVFSGAAYAIRAEGGEIALIAVVLALVRSRFRLADRITAMVAVIAGFAIFGGSYIWIEGGSILSEKPHLEVRNDMNAFYHTVLAWGERQPRSSAMVANIDMRPLMDQIRSLPETLRSAPYRTIGRPLLEYSQELANTLKGVWLLLALAYPFLPHRQRMRRGWRAPPILLAALHTVLLFYLLTHNGYLSRRHVLLVATILIVPACGSLVWIARQIANSPAVRAGGPRSFKGWWAKRADFLILAGITVATSPWLFRDIGDGRAFLHEAAAWVERQYAGREDLQILSEDPWVPFYAGRESQQLWNDVASSKRIAGADLLIVQKKTPVPETSFRPPRAETEIRLTELATFSDPKGRRAVVIYRVELVPPTTTHSEPD